jgi:transposase-like protein
MKKRQFTQDYKLEAVRLFREGKKPAADLARQLGITRSRWYYHRTNGVCGSKARMQSRC